MKKKGLQANFPRLVVGESRVRQLCQSMVLTTVILQPLGAWAGPTLYYEKLWVNLSVPACLQKAETLITQAKIPILNVNATRVLAVGSEVSVVIDCERIDQKTRSVIMVSSAGENPMVAIELTTTLKKGME